MEIDENVKTIIVVAYVFKDNEKETGKNMFWKQMYDIVETNKGR